MPASRSRLGVIFLTVLIDLLGFGIVLPILPYYAQQFGARGLGYGALVGVYSLMQFFATALLGRLSDRVGRRPVLLTTMILNAVGYVLFAFAGSYVALLGARVISGFAGGNISAAQAYVADVTSADDRSRGMALLGAAFGLGFVLGPAVGGLVGGHTAPGLIAAGLSLVNFASAWLILPESLRPEHRTTSRALGLGAIGRGLADRRLRPLMILWGLVPFAFSGYAAALPFFAGRAFGWGQRQLGVFFIIVGAITVLGQGYLFGQLARRFGDRRLLIVGTLGMALAVAIVPGATSSMVLYTFTVPLAFANSFVSPAASGLVSVYAAPTEQGAVLGAAQALGALGRFAGPEVFGGLWDARGVVVFFAAGAIIVLAWLATLGLPRPGDA